MFLQVHFSLVRSLFSAVKWNGTSVRMHFGHLLYKYMMVDSKLYFDLYFVFYIKKKICRVLGYIMISIYELSSCHVL